MRLNIKTQIPKTIVSKGVTADTECENEEKTLYFCSYVECNETYFVILILNQVFN